MTDHSAFDNPELQHDPDRPHHIRIINAPIEDRNGTPTILAPIPFAELEKAKRGTGQHKNNIGFTLDIEFTHPTKGPYVLRAAWIRMAPR